MGSIRHLMLCVFLMSLGEANAQMFRTLSPGPGGANYTAFVFLQPVIDDSGTVIFHPDVQAITNRGTNVPFSWVVQSTNPFETSIIRFNFSPPLDSTAETFTFYGTNEMTNVTALLAPIFIVQPQGQSVFTGANVIFVAQAVHNSGYQWQKDGTNLVEDGHFYCVTNSTLTISNATFADSGTYSILALHPTLLAVSSDVQLAVFKPIRLSAAQSLPGFARLIAANADQSPFEAERLAKVDFYSSSDFSQAISNWTISTNPVVLTNGMLQIDFANDGVSNQFWIAVERP